MEIQTAGVVGLGTMGAGIVEVYARAGLAVIAVEIDDDLLAAGRSRLAASFERAVTRGRLDEAEAATCLQRVSFTTDRAALAAADLVSEAVPERLEVKESLFADLHSICPPSTVLATNTSSLAVTRIAASTGRPGRVLGMHFFNPAPVMRLVEVVHTVLTDGEVVEVVRALAVRCGKTPVVVGDRAGFVANALLFGYLNAAAGAAETEQAAVADIDAALVAACGLPMGPLTLLDLIGLDVSLDVLETLYDETRDQRYAASPLLRRLVMAGQLGRKSGRGFYSYELDSPRPATGTAGLGAGPTGAGPRVVGVGGREAPVLAALADVAVVTLDEVGAADAELVVVDGGARTGSAELAARVASAVKPGVVIAVATTDEAPVGTLAAGTGRAADVVGLHLPLAPRPGVVEVVATLHSSPQAVTATTEMVRGAGLVALPCRDRPGYVVDTLVLPHLGDAVRMVDDRYATVADVEAAMTLGCGYPAGPFAMLEAVSADAARSRLLHLAAATHLASLAPSPLLDELAAFG